VVYPGRKIYDVLPEFTGTNLIKQGGNKINHAAVVVVNKRQWGTFSPSERCTSTLATVPQRSVCMLVALVLVTSCGSPPHHRAYTQSGDFDRGLMARAAEFVTALNTRDSHRLEDLVSPGQKDEVPAFLAAYGGRDAALLRFPDHLDGPDTEGIANIQITCSASKSIVLSQVFVWEKGNWRTYIYLPGQKVGVTDQSAHN
jgi:hypothetical protein